MSRRRRHRHDDHTNHEAWAIPYADLMTLLLAFFVVMYAVSVVNEGKYRVMSQSMIQAFNGSTQTVASDATATAVPARPERVPSPDTPTRTTVMAPVQLPLPRQAVAARPGAALDSLSRIEMQVRKALQPLIDQHQVAIRRDKENQLEIEIRTDILFPSAVAQLSAPAQVVLRNLAGVLAGFNNPLRIEGFTDDVPISNTVFPSNWELSAARAGSVARLFVGSGVAQERLGIVGWGEQRPVAENDSAEGRNKNRRVLVVVMGNGAVAREHSDANALGRQAGVESAPGSLPVVRAIAPPIVPPATITPAPPAR